MRNPTKSPTTTKALPVKYKVEIKEGSIVVDGVDIGYMYQAGGAAHVSVLVNKTADYYGDREFFGRYKHLKSPMGRAKTAVKDILSRLTPEEYVAKLKEPTRESNPAYKGQTKSPHEVHGEVLGFDTNRAFHEAVFGPIRERFAETLQRAGL
jgi:hypothetical protein